MITAVKKQEAVRLLTKGRTYKEIAEMFGVSPTAVKQFFYRCRKQSAPRLICNQCHQPIKLSSNRQHHFCSYSCRMKWWQKHPEAYSNKEQHCYRCKTCGKSFYSRRVASYCSRLCYYESMKGRSRVHDI